MSGMFNTIRAVLIDLSGTLHIENLLIPGSVEALKRLRKSNVLIKFVTNTTKECKRILLERLSLLGFDITLDEIHSSLSVARQIVDERQLNPLLLLAPDALEDFQGVGEIINQKPNAVIIGLAPTEFHYESLNEAFRILLTGAPLIAIHAGKYYKKSDGLALGPGCFVKGLEYSANCKAEVIGKPAEAFFKSALPEDIKLSEAVMIGDDVTDDIKGALKIGMKGILVQTGKYQEGDELKITPRPTSVVPDFAAAVDVLLNDLSSNINNKE